MMGPAQIEVSKYSLDLQYDFPCFNPALGIRGIEMTLVELSQIALLFIGICFCFIAFLTFIFHYFVALRATPKKRAVWTVAPAYLIVVALFLFEGPSEAQLYAPLAALPGAAIAFWYWLRDFRSGWVDDGLPLPDGIKLANDDWRIGVLIIIGLFVASAVKVFLFRS